MGAPKQKWTAEEEEALKAGVNKHGTGKWKNIQKDPEYTHILAARSNIDLKDKWRNMSVSATGEGSRPKGVKAAAAVAATTPKVPKTQSAIAIFQSSSSSQTTEEAKDKVLVDHTKNTTDGKPPPRYNAMILEALSNIKDPNGADIGAIDDFIERRHEVPSNFRRLLSSKLRRLVAQDKLEKVQNYYKIKKDATFGTRSHPKAKESQAKKSPDCRFPGSTIMESSIFTAQKIAEAENKSFVASEAVKEAERVEGMAEHSACMKQFFEDILEQCKRGEPVIMAF
ncbi:hypothetical protein C5167_031456 [Papaver somniferum]|uniref:MYB transcription factor n=1 Tax=Papaver somniferum TaxID=3469 RepID=A0A4Y7K5V0_PAPSO|nr:single myb histone 3-like [Papaver somniferum]RZC68206.1 hypothetical protein C5167_031456 [Papaver somniferum]